jgi:alpha/beta superfamily hydrolase
MTQIFALTIPAPHGHLEGLLRTPAKDVEPRAVAVICHPHPQYGGTMHNKVVYQAAKTLSDMGFVAVRFNFRGVGRSTGTYDEGRGERDDVRAVLDYVHERYAYLPMILGGFSFGAWVALPIACEDGRVTTILGMGVPTGILRTDALTSCTKPKLIVQGEHDEYGPLDQLQAWYARLSEPKRLVVVPGADHFFTGHLAELGAAIANFFAPR